MSGRTEGIIAGLAACLVAITFIFGIFWVYTFYTERNDTRNQQCKTKYGQEFHYSPVRGEPYCINDKTGEGRWSL